jgi:hypothetical protein
MNICPSCGKGVLTPVIKSSPYLIVKESVTQNELTSEKVFVMDGKSKYGQDEHTTSWYLAKEMGMVGLHFPTFSLSNLYMHIPPKSGRTKEGKAITQGCIDWSISQLVDLAKDYKIVFMMGAELVKTFTEYNSSDVYGLVCKSDLLPTVPVVIPAPNSDKLMAQPIGEMRNALKTLAEQIKIYEQYKEM